MTQYIMIQELFWNSHTARAATPETKEVDPKNFKQGSVWWFVWDTSRNTLQYHNHKDAATAKFPFNDQDRNAERPCKRQCNTTVVFIDVEGFSSVPYNPIRDNLDHWEHWWGLGFNGGDNEIYTIKRNDETFDRQAVEGNSSGWFRLFRETNHHHNGVTAQGEPRLIGVPSLIWALVAFQFTSGNLPAELPRTLNRGDGTLKVLAQEAELVESRRSQRALAVEIWAHDKCNLPETLQLN